MIEELKRLAERMNADPEPIRGLRQVYQFNLSDSGEVYQARFQDGAVTVTEGATDSADCALTLSEGHFLQLLRNDLNAPMAFITGKLKIDGSIGLALKLQEALKSYL